MCIRDRWCSARERSGRSSQSQPPRGQRQKPARTAHEAGSAGSGHDFRGVCFSVAYTTPNGKSCRSFPKNRSIYHNSRCTYPLKRPQPLSGAKNAKRQENTKPNQKNAPESFLEGCITMHESDVRSVSCVLNTERLKTTSFLPWCVALWRGFLFPNFTSRQDKKKPTWGRWQESESMGNILVIGCSIFTNAKNASVMP